MGIKGFEVAQPRRIELLAIELSESLGGAAKSGTEVKNESLVKLRQTNQTVKDDMARLKKSTSAFLRPREPNPLAKAVNRWRNS